MKITARGLTAKRSQRRPVQYTVRDVPAAVDAALRHRAKGEGKSLNSFLRDALVREAGVEGADGVRHHDLDALAGRWEADAEFDAAIVAQDAVDEELWR
jgi:plasmid stability protein